MSSIINTNIASLNAQRNLSTSQSGLTTALQRLSSGLRINSAKDDAAGLAISQRMTSQINGLDQAARNANDGISLAQTAEGSLSAITDNLQRIRTLSLQAANSTNSASDRAALNAEVQSSLAEIGRVASTTQFNGLNLLDGTFTAAQFQVGANANQTINVTVGGATTSQLGAYQYNNTTNAVSGSALVSGDLTINGVNVGASTSGSADTIVNAINSVTNQTSVTASATSSLVAANNPTRKQDLASGDLVINGVDIGAVTGAYNVATQGASLVTAINLKSTATGVTATSNAVTGGITLASSTGKTIAVTTNNGAAGAAKVENATGLEVSSSQTVATSTNTFAAGTEGQSNVVFTAAATNGDQITVDGIQYTFAAANAGLTTVATGADQTASAANLAAQITAKETALGTAGHITAASAGGTMTVTSKFATSTATHTTITEQTDAGANMVENNNNVVGVGVAVGGTLTVGGTTYQFGFADSAAVGSNTMVTLGTTGTNTAQAFLTAVNAAYTADTTNIQATGGANVITLTSDNKGAQGTTDVTGTSITSLTVGGAAGGANGSYTANTAYGVISLNSNAAYSIAGNNSAKAGLSTASSTLSAISTIDISSVTGANNAIALVDGAISQVNTTRANLGAVQNRFSSTISNLQSSSENISAARSRIQDTDFAAETAALTRGQILQQAGTAMLAQANSLPNGVLALLR
ncbi:MAG: flagellin N-terminal helical domain-containing protein [Burkholderiaceae bacterium]